MKELWYRILSLFGKKNLIDEKLMNINDKKTKEYEYIQDINFTSIFSNKLANLTISDSNIDLDGDDLRSEALKDVLKKLKRKLKKVVARQLGTGGCLVIPYVANNKLYFNIISQSRLCINKSYGEDIVDCTILADTITKGQTTYKRWADYTLENGTLSIKYKVTGDKDSVVDITSIPEWSNIQDTTISNVEKMPFMYIKSPIDNRRENDEYGVPITFGCDKQIKEIKETLEEILREYRLKEAFVGADVTMFKGENALPSNGLYQKINAGEDGFWEVFDPAIRDSSLYTKLEKQCEMLEKQVGTSKGILTPRETGVTTATEIRASQKDTFDMVDDIRTSLEDGIDDFIKACEVLINYYNLAPNGQYEVKFDWDYSLIEDSTMTFNQLVTGLNNGVIKEAELRQFIKPEETLEEAQAVIDEIKENEPSTKDLIGE